jgi:hypothetical protein
MSTNKKYKIDAKRKLQFQSFVALKRIANYLRAYPTGEGSNTLLKPVLDELTAQGFLKVHEEVLVPTDLGKTVLKNILNRARDCRGFLEIYSGVDFGTGQYAVRQVVAEGVSLSNIKTYLANPRWTDIRLAVGEFKKLTPSEVAFYLALDEGVFEPDEGESWEEALMNDRPWKWIENYCSYSLSQKELACDSDPTGAKLLKTVIKLGAKHNQALYKHLLNKTNYSQAEAFDVVEADEPTEITYRNYLKASYASPCWFTDVTTGKKTKAPGGRYW